MRFAYIDSHGNEVPIPSVDALALRIELGAIGPDTQLYDAQADHWAPASTHEIFHTLSRDSQADGFVAPPPVAPPPPAPAPPPPSTPAAKASAKPKAKKKADAPAPTASDLGLTLADPPPSAPPPAPEPEVGGFDLSLDLAPPPVAPAPPAPKSGGGEGGGMFDYGDLSSGLQLEEEHGEPMLSFDSPMQFGSGGSSDDGIQLEQPMSEFSPDSPPGWMEDPPSKDAGSLSFSPATAEPAAPIADAGVRAPRREPKDRPSPPKFKKQRSLAAPIFLTVVLLALGVGGYWGWPLVQARLSRPEAPVRPAVVIPTLPEELAPRFRELADASIAATIVEADVATRSADAPAEMPAGWLSGNYLANASQFAGVEAFWTSMGALMDRVRGSDPQGYREELAARAGAAGLDAEAAGLIVERADSGFLSVEEARLAAYEEFDQIVDAALALHSFLVDNEDAIDYRPATSSTADPILEAVPSTPALGNQMLELVDGVTERLTDLGSLDRVTRERLVQALVSRVQQVGLR